MAYEVTATRKRPQTFEQMVGQDFVVTTLKASLESKKIAHSYLFSGPRGVGKTSAARILAKSMNCENGPTATPCGTCGNCREITLGNSLDVIEIDGASNTSVNDVREIKDEVLFSPNSARYKIYIIDEVHMLSNSAFNALLKTIEEPPPYVIFVFATTEVHKVPATIRSRCQQFVFRLISIDTIKEQLQETTEEAGIKAENDALFWIAKEATGSLRDAYTLFDQIASFSDGNITMELIREKLGTVGIDSMNEIVELLVAGLVKEALGKADGVLYRGVSVDQFVIDMAEYFRCLLFLKHGIESHSILGYSPDRFSRKVLGALNEAQLGKALEQVFQLYRDLRYSLNQRFELELMLSRLALLTTFTDPKELLKEIAELRNQLIQGEPGSEIVEADEQAVRGEPSSFAPRDPQTGHAPAPGPVPGPERSAVTAHPDASPLADDPGLETDTRSSTRAVSGTQAAVPAASDGQPGTAAAETPAVAHAVAHAVARAAIPEGELTSDRREAVMLSIRKKHLTLASSLEKVTSWRIAGDALVLTCGSSFDAAHIRREQQKILEAVSSGLGTSFRIVLKSDQESEEGEKEKSPAEEGVEMIRRVFRGEIVDDA